MRRLFLTVAVLCVAAPAAAEDAGRFQLAPGANGFTRLDTRTGETSHCAPQDGVWRCDPMIEDPGVLAAELDVLAARVDGVAAAVAELGARVDALAGGVEAPPAVTGEAAPEIEERGFVATAVGRLFALVRLLKHGPAEV